jgi:hypothetical protein
MITLLLLPYLFICGPLVLALAAWAKLYWGRQWPAPIALVALGILTANAALAAGTFLYYDFNPSPLPPWKNPAILLLAMLFLLAPIGMIVGFAAAVRGGPGWLVWIVEIASLPLLVIGFMASSAV